jgi:uncharacterized protein (DUF1800 family)
MWHNHFATSNLKVNDLKLMHRQNLMLRKHAMGPFADLLKALVRDPALLNWLDAPANRQGHPNENLARELMELFTLGIGHYSENDVKVAARALTGWTVRQGEFRELPAAHDVGEKTILGRSGNWSGDDLVGILLEHPATARRLAWRLTNEFFGEGIVDVASLEALAAGLQENNLDIRWAVETMLRSNQFFSAPNFDNRVCDPVSFLISPLRALECWRQTPSTLVLAEWVTRMGQDLFYPPNVGGWHGGRAWLSTRTIIARTNFVAALVTGNLQTPPQPPQLDDLVAKYASKHDLRSTATFLPRLLFGREEAHSRADLSHQLLELLTGPGAHLH